MDNRAITFSGKMNGMGSSIDLLISFILEKLGCDLRKKPLGNKINQFAKCRPRIYTKYSGEFNHLIDKMKRFNENWNITKHGIIGGGTQNLTFYKDGIIYEFDQKKIIEIDWEFSEVMKGLTEIWNRMLKE